ncbi:MAG: DMT family transporter [Fimbriimonadales bacterium]
MSKKGLGTLFVSVSATAFGTYSYFALMSAKAGFRPVPMLFYRFGLAALILALLAVFTRTKLPSRRQVAALAGLGCLYVGQSFAYILCLRASNPITASLLLYIYPAFVTIGSVLFLKEKLTKTVILALLCALFGSVLVVGPVREISGLAILYGLGTSIFYATYLIVGKRVLADVPPLGATLVILSTAALVYGAASLFTGFDLPANPSGWIGPVCLALVATVIAIGGLLAGLRWISPVEASSLSALEPLVTAVLAVVILGQRLEWWHVAGGALVILAVLVLARHAGRVETSR